MSRRKTALQSALDANGPGAWCAFAATVTLH